MRKLQNLVLAGSSAPPYCSGCTACCRVNALPAPSASWAQPAGVSMRQLQSVALAAACLLTAQS